MVEHNYLCTSVHEIIINSLKVVDNDALSAVISLYKSDVIVLTQEITA